MQPPLQRVAASTTEGCSSGGEDEADLLGSELEGRVAEECEVGLVRGEGEAIEEVEEEERDDAWLGLGVGLGLGLGLGLRKRSGMAPAHSCMCAQAR